VLPITTLFAGLLVPLYISLAVRVIFARRSEKVGIGDGGKALLLRRMRAHANFAEYVPYALLLLGLAESMKSPTWLLFASGALLVIGRAVHAYGISQSPEPIVLRQIGMASTFTVLGVLGTICFFAAARMLASS
jgi:uncharacterized protein